MLENRADKFDRIAYSVGAWAQSLGVERRTLLTRLNRKGFSPEPQQEIPAADVFNSWLGEKEAAQIRLNEAKAQQVEQENLEKAGILIHVDVAAKIYGDKIQALVERIGSMPAMLDSKLAAETSALKCREIMAEFIEESKKQCRETFKI